MAEIMYESTGCTCYSTSYSSSDIDASAQKALSLASQGKTLGRDRYPHAYNDYEHFQFAHAEKPYLEFPIMPDGQVYDGGPPITDRVVVGSIAADFSSAIYCAVVTHQGEEKDAFTECRDDDVVVAAGGDQGAGVGKGQGQGQADQQSFKERREHHHEKRRLLERIDL